MAWGYRLEGMGSREAARGKDGARGCSVGACDHPPQFLSAYRYMRADGRAVTATRTLCVRHARLFSMKYSLAWPDMMRRPRRSLTAVWTAMAA